MSPREKAPTQGTRERAIDRLEKDVEELRHFAPSPVLFELHSPDGSMAILQAQERVTVNADLIESVRQICGTQAIELVM